MRENRWIKTEEGKTHLIILLLGIIGILLSIVFRENLSITVQDILLSISSSIVASAVVSFITAGYIARRDKNAEVYERWGLNSISRTRAVINGEVDVLLDQHVSQVDIIAYGLKSFREAKDNRIKELIKQGTHIRIITVDYDSSLLNIKDKDENKLIGETKESIIQLSEWCKKKNKLDEAKGSIELRYIENLPTEVYFRVDDSCFTGPYEIGRESQQTITFRYTTQKEGGKYYVEYFEQLWLEAQIKENTKQSEQKARQ